jgi:predicted transcriptional regulator
MQTQASAKQEALDAIQRLPDTTDTEEMMYRLYVLENIRRGQEDSAEGKVISTEELLKEIKSW